MDPWEVTNGAVGYNSVSRHVVYGDDRLHYERTTVGYPIRQHRCDSLQRQCDSLKRMALESKSNGVITEKKQIAALTWFEVFAVIIVTLVGIGAILIKYSQSKDKKQ